jgi:AraC family transcriptional regulator, regulatory protein of adaptative response / methylated-DNA-[protein]-cysteine methyltransferase
MSGSTTHGRLAAATERDPRWTSVITRDSKADGMFYYSVDTTGVYCRPSCAARPAKPKHVQFHTTREDAEQAGFRPCKRCTPDRPASNTRRRSRTPAGSSRHRRTRRVWKSWRPTRESAPITFFVCSRRSRD